MEITIDCVENTICKVCNITKEELYSKGRDRKKRWQGCYFLRCCMNMLITQTA